MAGANILEVRGLVVEYGGDPEHPVRAVDGVDLDVHPGEFLGLVGESGCGKSTLCFAIARLLDPPAAIIAGEVRFHGQNLVVLRERRLRSLRWRDFSVVMQSAMNALNPVMTVDQQFRDALKAHARTGKAEARERGAEVLRMVGIDPIHLDSYPFQLSGGMRQRAMIAMALLFSPELIVMDEPTSALDVVAQRSLMVQIKQLQQQLGFAVIFVTHDMSLVGSFSDRLAIMYAAQVVEDGETRAVFAAPQHPYTQGLLSAFPSIHGPRRALSGIPGSPPDLRHPPSGCRFHPRCPHVMPVCRGAVPPLYRRDPGLVRCYLYAPEEVERVQLSNSQ